MIYVLGSCILSLLGRQVPIMWLCEQIYVPTTRVIRAHTHTHTHWPCSKYTCPAAVYTGTQMVQGVLHTHRHTHTQNSCQLPSKRKNICTNSPSYTKFQKKVCLTGRNKRRNPLRIRMATVWSKSCSPLRLFLLNATGQNRETLYTARSSASEVCLCFWTQHTRNTWCRFNILCWTTLLMLLIFYAANCSNRQRRQVTLP